jgi:alpha-amylase/alpha-mannosidase (GH57 family)
MNNTKLLFGIHCHQPIDNFDHVVYDAIAKSYKPFFQTLQNFPSFKCSVHFSGWLLEFIQKNDSELFSLIQKLSVQIEFFSGGFYEPILASIPSKDRIAQIQKLNIFIETYFNQTPKGLWLTERVWDDSIIGDLKKCGIEYVIVDDYHLLSNGTTQNLEGYYLTENNGETIALFPISKDLRYTIPFSSTAQIEEKLESFISKDGSNGAIIFDDGEKFGIWPKTYELCYEHGWLKDFFALDGTNETIESQTYKEFFESNKPLGLIYLKTVSYEEMGHWSNLDRSYHYSQSGIWKNFFIKYQESNWIHKRVLELSKNQTDDELYLDCLYKAQCNDVLWHGVFGGIYLPNLRDNAYKYIIECEKMQPLEALSIYDIDFDGYLEYKLSSNDLLAIVKPNLGASIVELDIKAKNFNLLNTLTRREEEYHKNIKKEAKIENNEIATIHDNVLTMDENIQIHQDSYLKKSSMNSICDDSSLFTQFINLSDAIFTPIKENESTFTHTFNMMGKEGNIQKEYSLKNNTLETNIILETQEKRKMKFVDEWNLHFAIYNILEINGKLLEDNITITSNKLEIFDPYLSSKIIFDLTSETEIFISKDFTVSQSESGLDLTVQHLSLQFVTNFSNTLEYKITFKIEEV